MKCIYSDTGNNALDFVLVTLLGYLVRDKDDGTDFVIVSNDRGYDAVVKFLVREGVSARQCYVP